ncbi:MAG: urease accessory protein UreD [Opitutae bacterium]|jgi:urease accessory protein|nr:urease accessory protein UreD [Opitutae bacterium]
MKNTFGLNGGVKLGCRRNGEGVPYLSSQRFSAPVHLSKPYFDEDTGSLLVNLSCPTAGLLAGDRVVCDIEVSDQASMVVTTPGATRSHFMRSGIARVEQKFKVKDGSFLEFNPGALILQKATNLEQVTEIEVDEDSEVLFVEKMLPGRIAHGESFVFQKFSNRLRIEKENKIVLLESFILDPGNESVLPWKNSFPTPYYGSFYLISPKPRDHLPCRERIHGMMSPNLLTGVTSLHRKAGWMVKVLAGDPYEFKRAVKEIRKLLHADIERLPTDFRRY